VPRRLGLDDRVVANGAGLQQVAGADQLGRGAVDDAHVGGHHAVQDQQPQPPGAAAEARPQLARPGRDLDHLGGRDLARDHAHAQVELVGEIGVRIEQVAVGRRRPALPHRTRGRRRQQRWPLLDPSGVALLHANPRGRSDGRRTALIMPL
jgi:hypothetical protein